MKQFVLSGLFTLFVGSSLLFAQKNFRVQISAFDQKVPVSHFYGLEDVWVVKDHNDIYRYNYGGDYDNKAEADAMAKKAVEAGYAFAKVVDLEEARVACVCDQSGTLTSIFFNFDRYDLRPDAIDQLNTLVDILRSNRDYRAILEGHTDAKGSLEYNESLSEARVRQAQRYLLNSGIDASRVQLGHFGENQPVAKNELSNGSDSPQGRQLNRRVTIEVLDTSGKIVPGLVRAIQVPYDLIVAN